MRPSRFVVLLPPLAALVLAGCSGSSAGQGSGNGAGGPTSTGPASSAASAVPSETTGVATPDTVQTSTLLAALTAVDGNLALNPTQAVSNATALCVALREGGDATTAVPAAFPNATLDASQQTAVAAAVTSTFCPLDGSPASSAATPSPS